MQLQNSGFRPGPRRKCPTSDALTGFAVTEVKLVASSGSWGTNFSEKLVNASEVGHRRRTNVRERGISRQGRRIQGRSAAGSSGRRAGKRPSGGARLRERRIAGGVGRRARSLGRRGVAAS